MQQCSVEPNTAGGSHHRSRQACARLADFLAARSGLAGIVLTSPGAVAWATGGVAAPVDRSAPVDLVWVLLTQRRRVLITTEVERERVLEEYDPSSHGFELAAVPWYETGAFVEAALAEAGAGADALAADGHPAFGRDVADDLIELRLSLSEPERTELRSLGALAAGALSVGLRSWRPGKSRDLDVQAAIAAELEAGGADAPVLIVGGDERVRRYRHPVAVGAVVHELVMAVVVARRAGLHVACTRFAARGLRPPADKELERLVGEVDDAVLSATRPGQRYAEVLDALAEGYAAVGHPGAWAEHYQGGPIGFNQREFEIAPGQRNRFARTRVEAGQAVAWNPSLRGGVKIEDTYLVEADGLELVTTDPDWPSQAPPGSSRRRPAVLEVAA